MSQQHHTIHPTAVIAPGVKIGRGVTIEPYVVIASPGVELHDLVTIKSHVYLDGHVSVGEGTVIYPGASIGTKPQDLKYRGEKTLIEIGKNCEIREFVTINSSCQEGSVLKVGEQCLIMAYCHIAHNCTVGDHVIMSNNSTLAGHVTVEPYAIIGGHTPVHQFVRIGTHAMVGGMSRITHDVPPYTLGGGIPYKFGGINVIGLKRHGFSLDKRRELRKAFQLLYRSGLPFTVALETMKRDLLPLPEVAHLIQFCEHSKRGLLGFQEEVIKDEPEEEGER